MARTSTKANTATENKTTETKESLQNKLNEKTEENNKMLEMIKALQDQINALSANQTQTTSTVSIVQNEDLTRTVKVISLLNNTFNLSTKPLGGGKVFTFETFGEVKNIKYTDLQDILEIYKSDFETGRAILGSKKDYDDLQIGYAYDNVFDIEEFKEIISLKTDRCVEIILDEMEEDMQDNVCSLIATNINNGKQYDYNKIKELEDNGLEITKLANFLKEEEVEE